MKYTIKIPQLIRYLSRYCGEEEDRLIRLEMDKDSRFNRLVTILQKTWRTNRKFVSTTDIDVAWHKFKTRIESSTLVVKEKSTQKTLKWSPIPFIFTLQPLYASRVIQVAAVCILLFSSSYYFVKHNPWEKEAVVSEMKTISVGHGKRMNFTLSDGSKITLDAGGQIQYPSVFLNRRDIYLKGEAYFEVTYDPERPFYVHAHHALIKVMSTKFNVRAWDRNNTISVMVTKGKVAFGRSKLASSESVIIRAGNLSRIINGGTPTTPEQVNVRDHLGWMKNEIYFRNTKIAEIFNQLVRWYDYEIEISDEAILQQHMTIHIMKSNITEVLDLIATLTNTKVQKDGKKIKFFQVKTQ